MQAIELSYTRQDGSLDLDYKGIRTLTDMSVNFWQIGSIRYLTPPGKMQPFVLASLGATYFSPSDATFLMDRERSRLQSSNTRTATKFSLNLVWVSRPISGKRKRSACGPPSRSCPPCTIPGAASMFGTGGGGVTVAGNAIWQWEAAGGIDGEIRDLIPIHIRKSRRGPRGPLFSNPSPSLRPGAVTAIL